MELKQIPMTYSFNKETSNKLIDILAEQNVNLPTDVDVNQIENLRCIVLTRRLNQIPFDFIKIDHMWFVKQVLVQELSISLKQGDRLLVIHKTTIVNDLNEIDISKLILYSPVPFLIWVIWDADTYVQHKIKLQQNRCQETYLHAKAHLLKTKHHGEISLYDHLAYIIADAIENPHVRINDLLEKLNYPTLRSDLRPPKVDIDVTVQKLHAQLLQGTEQYLLKSQDFVSTAVPYLMDIGNYCTNAGYGIHITEIILIWSAMKRLNDHINCTEMKFWGKIFGLHCDYYIVQVQHENEIPFDEINICHQRRLPKIEKQTRPSNKPIFHQTVVQRESLEIPSEPHGVGANQYTYFATNSPGLPWIKLSDVKPAMIDHARKIRWFFTGCLSAPVNGFPPFVGLEKDYLRAQIARITATTHISPAGFFILEQSETEEEEEGGGGGEGDTTLSDQYKDPEILVNAEFNDDPTNPVTAESLADTSLQEWVHSLPEILPQGRTQFWRPSSIETTVQSQGEDESIEEEIVNENKFQTRAPLLRPIGEDKHLHTNQTSWSIGLTMSVMREYSMCYVRSNIWPGAFTLGDAKKYFNLYIGWGHKYEQFNPSQPALPQTEVTQVFIEKMDPSVEVEKAFEVAKRAVMSELTSEESTHEEQTTEEENESEQEDEEEAEDD
ncbi:unnamed protein product [Adineta ricciae]|uniref:Uncharacterized protein n=1 Tax=Adineta ricciae TaxID=249248 RepID=A0A814HUP4_ADIRI|nr:unnamed protein product [Adineta ricciae]